MLMALTHPLRSADLAGLSLDHRKYSPKGYIFARTKLANNFFLPFLENKLLCPVITLCAYEEKDEVAIIGHNSILLSLNITQWLIQQADSQMMTH